MSKTSSEMWRVHVVEYHGGRKEKFSKFFKYYHNALHYAQAMKLVKAESVTIYEGRKVVWKYRGKANKY